ncbi:nucleoside phosphatase [Trypanosoma grayi]|uniref:nucleoside phosphatase n=1 Tax=Trypanosoma grayi TaxID=71804 RepID=UPI0004F4557F|nr:nucleoside phosphatase [Trypanosoma grayi]KEG08450.1 nucleoside phosphatase [Trypanosoma grayi]
MRSFQGRRVVWPYAGPIFVLLTTVVVLTVYLTAYSVGGSSMVSRGQQRVKLTNSIINIKTERFLQCRSRVQLLKSGQATAAQAAESAAGDREKLRAELELFENRNAIVLQAVEDCKRESEGLKEKRSAAAVEQWLEQLEEERQRYVMAIALVNSTANSSSSSSLGWGNITGLVTALEREMEMHTRGLRNDNSVLERCYGAMQRYSIVFDAGSTGSRVHVFRYNLSTNPHAGAHDWRATRPSLMPFLRLEDELFVENHNPLSGYANADEAAASLSPLLEAAKAYVPAEMHTCAPVELKATAGLRRIGRERAEAVLQAVRRHFRSGPFWLQSEGNAVRILEGSEEGPLAWLTVNYLRGAMSGNTATATIVDLGGGSTQIVMHPKDSKVLDARKDFSHVFRANGNAFVVYQHSYEGNGLHAAKEQLLRAVEAAAEEASGSTATAAVEKPAEAAALRSAFPCFPKGYVYKERNISNVKNGGVAPSMEKCVALFKKHVVRGHEPCGTDSCGFNGIFQPNVTAAASGPVYAFSFYYDRLKPYLDGEATTVQNVERIASDVCSRMKTAEDLQNVADAAKQSGTLRPEMECFELSYLFALLHHGFGFPREQQLHIAKKINGFETAWALGASLVTLEGQSG